MKAKLKLFLPALIKATFEASSEKDPQKNSEFFSVFFFLITSVRWRPSAVKLIKYSSNGREKECQSSHKFKCRGEKPFSLFLMGFLFFNEHLIPRIKIVDLQKILRAKKLVVQKLSYGRENIFRRYIFISPLSHPERCPKICSCMISRNIAAIKCLSWSFLQQDAWRES